MVGLQALQHSSQFMAIDIRHKVKALARPFGLVQCAHHHLRPQIGATNADMDHIGDLAVGPHLLGKGQHGVQGVMHLGQRFGQCPTQTVGRLAQQPMHDRSTFGGVDGLTRKHGIAPRGHTALFGQGLQQLLGFGVDGVFGKIHLHARRR